ncbi:Protein of unknown function [Gryllus bimaculatus]|nr:Protein of unknown function [Gryllus bimaculatus]
MPFPYLATHSSRHSFKSQKRGIPHRSRVNAGASKCEYYDIYFGRFGEKSTNEIMIEIKNTE